MKALIALEIIHRFYQGQASCSDSNEINHAGNLATALQDRTRSREDEVDEFNSNILRSRRRKERLPQIEYHPDNGEQIFCGQNNCALAVVRGQDPSGKKNNINWSISGNCVPHHREFFFCFLFFLSQQVFKPQVIILHGCPGLFTGWCFFFQSWKRVFTVIDAGLSYGWGCLPLK